METYQKNNRENFVLADMHGDGVYFDQAILRTFRLKTQKEIVQEGKDRH
ncbi:hypothetical protein C8P64_2029 [Christiangramia gaetbulicola]|uniref:Uncharacterized protein n=1 Tax=Christiangramia gaetbulicola TaxID=703340 RepID=A0A2T6AI78_9FLAO|nr:hypothetical protein [Christiangramia gaetbulicola]PTX43501.1 hypothetical protein C8P64_2029 [Christiangramia gaetbulicola]